ncbi:MAG: phage/plasmid primase, P4 family, partial [Oscillospiraceae bacterium]
ENLCFAANRLPVSYVEEFLPPNLWLKFLSELLHEEDILTLQEYLGYCLIPTKRAQKMLFLIGGGGEGKSVIGGVLRDIFGSSLLSGKLKDLEGDNFILASLEGALVFLDDDITSCGFQESQTIKSLVTDMQPTQVNPKGQKRYSAVLYPRLIAFGNMAMATLYDHSDGVFRRRLILTTKEKPKNRIDDVYLPEKLRKETSSIFLWCAEGLLRLQQNGYRFTQSDRTKKNLEESRRDSFNFLSFLEDDNYLVFDPDCKSSTTYLYEMYSHWCHENSETPIKAKTMVTYLKQHSGKYQITYSENLIFSNTRKRGFVGLGVSNPHGYCT